MGDLLPLPPGFEKLSIEDKIGYVQSLWDHIAAEPDTVPLADWQKTILDERLDDLEKNPDRGIPWEEVLAGIARRVGKSQA